MQRIEEELPAGAHARFDADRGSEVAYVAEDLTVQSWRVPYTGPNWVSAPRFRATRDQLSQLEQALKARVSSGTLRVLRCSQEAEDGTCEWAAAAMSG